MLKCQKTKGKNMQKLISKVSLLKVGKIQTTKLKESKRGELVTAMKKIPIEKSYLKKDGFSDDEVADRVHHGGEFKAIFFMSSLTYQKINEALHVELGYENEASLGENILVRNIVEDDVCVGDIWQIGEAVVEISQPREPCWKLSASTDIKDMTKFIFQRGLTGWYGKVLQEGEIKKDDDIILKSRGYKNLTISKLNTLMIKNPDNIIMQEAINCPKLGTPFKNALKRRYKGNEEFVYQV